MSLRLQHTKNRGAMAGANQLHVRPSGGQPAERNSLARVAAPGMADVADVAVAAWLGRSSPLTQVRRRVLKESTGRPVVQYRYTMAHDAAVSRATVVSKGYYRGDGAATFAAMEYLWSAGFGDDARLTISQPLAYLPIPCLLLQTMAAGPSLYRFIDEPPTGARAVKMTGRWLAKLHNTAPGDGPLLDRARETARLATFRDALVGACPTFSSRIRSLSDRVAVDLEDTDAPLVPTHGDFQPKNVHISRGRVTVIDFDRFAVAEPVRDVGHFVAQSMTMSYVRTGSFAAIEEWNRIFLEAYALNAPAHALCGLAVATVRSMLEILYYKLVVRPVRDASFLAAWLDECDRCLSVQIS